ncbi:MAG: dihydropteroate synthase-like protein, partial [Candidatus Thorarchaeota archaeon]
RRIVMRDLRVLLLTGRMAYDELHKMVSNESNVSVEALPISVAAFTTPKLVRRHLAGYISKWNPDLVLVSGLARGDYSSIHEEVGVPVLKGTKNLFSIPLLLEHLDEVKHSLSSTDAADTIIQKRILNDLRSRLKALEREAVFGVRNFRLDSGLSLGVDLPPRIMAEVVDVTTRPIDVSIANAEKYSKWADIIDIGASIATKDPERIAEITQEVRKLGVSVSIDSLDPKEIAASVDAGAEMVLSIDTGNIEVASRIPEDIALVCLPTNVSAGEYPQNPLERAQRCHRLCNELKQNGHSKLLADPIMEAAIQPGLLKSLVAFYHYRAIDPDTPFLAGFANVTEFMDTDSLGVNAVLSCLGVELGVSVFLTTEERPSTINCVRELRSAAQLAFISKVTDSPPKELGITAFAAKSSKHSLQPVLLDDSYEDTQKGSTEYTPDPKGCFRIGVDFSSNRILCEHRGQKGKIQRLASDKMHHLLREIMKRDLVGSIEHAAYLGAELAKAEIALKLGHSYQQDEEWHVESLTDILGRSAVEDAE